LIEAEHHELIEHYVNNQILLAWDREGALISLQGPSGGEFSRYEPSIDGDLRLIPGDLFLTQDSRVG
jgi:hypothetical protein